MKIIVDNKEERVLINQLCDVALKADGLNNFKGVSLILTSIEGKKPHVTVEKKLDKKKKP